MVTFQDLKDFFKREDMRVIIAAEAETRISEFRKDTMVTKIPAGGVSVALDPIARASNALYIGRGKNEEEKQISGPQGKVLIEHNDGNYTLKRLFFSETDYNGYYNGFSNQTLWPLCHVAFERPQFHKNWYEAFERVNQKFAEAIKKEVRGKTFIWLNDYQLSLVPKYLGQLPNTTVSMFWHIPWPTWEIFRILPQKDQILESLLSCDFLAFHRGYQVRNFLQTVERELEARIDHETSKVYYKKHVTTVKNLPMGIDADVIKSLVSSQEEDSLIGKMVKSVLPVVEEKRSYEEYFKKGKVILSVDRLDYTKGLRNRMFAMDRFLERNRQYIGKVTYLCVIAPSREKIPSYIQLKKEVRDFASVINDKYRRNDWQPIRLLHEVFPRKEVMRFYKKADVCLVTPLDDGMNLVSKEFVIASSFSDNPGMLILSQFAGSAIDLTQAIIVNPYDIDEVAGAMKKALEMKREEKQKRINSMAQVLEERNVYEWAEEFVRSALNASR